MTILGHLVESTLVNGQSLSFWYDPPQLNCNPSPYRNC